MVNAFGKYENAILFFLCQQKKKVWDFLFVAFVCMEWVHEDYDEDKEMTDIFFSGFNFES